MGKIVGEKALQAKSNHFEFFVFYRERNVEGLKYIELIIECERSRNEALEERSNLQKSINRF